MDSNPENDGSVMDDQKEGTLTAMRGARPEAGSGDTSTVDQNTANPQIRNDIDIDGEASNMDVAELAQSRMEVKKRQQMAREAAWIAENQKEVLERKEFKETNSLKHLDQDAWEEIIEKLGPEEKVMMSKMAWEWRTPLERQRTLFLFGKVFPILCQHSFSPNEWGGDTKEAVSFVQDCRLVCKTWKESIDELLSSHNVTGTPADGIPQCLVAFLKLDQLVSFNICSEHNYRGRNPLFSRIFGGGGPLPTIPHVQYREEIERMLSRWGGELWTLNFYCDEQSMEIAYVFLCRFLSHLPNLQKLCLIDLDSGPPEVGRRWKLFRTRLGQDAYRSLVYSLASNPLPELPHLRSLMFKNFSPAPLIEDALTKYGDSLEVLEFYGVGQDGITGVGYMDPGEFLSGRVVLPALKKYSCCYGATTFKSLGPQTTQISHWNYQHLSLSELDLTYMDILEGAEVGNIFKSVSSCAPTLRRLRLVFNFRTEAPTARNWQDRLPDGVSLELPHLEVLDLCIAQSKITSVDFLLPLVSLKTLTFSYDAAKSDDSIENGKGIIQFVGYRDRLYESNIWKLLPELRLIKLKTVSVVKSWKLHSKDQRGIQYPFDERTKATVYRREGLPGNT